MSFRTDSSPPAMLNDLADDRPVLLFMMGSPAMLSADTAAIIGSRWPTEAGITAGNALADALITLMRDLDFSSPDELNDRPNHPPVVSFNPISIP